MQVAVLLAEGFEEIEALAVADILRRAGVTTPLVAVAAGAAWVTGAHGITVKADAELTDLEPGGLAAVVLPGGMPGARNLAESPAVLALLKQVRANGGLLAAICAGPLALQAAGLLRGRTVTGFSSIRDQLPGATYTGDRVTWDDAILTSKAAGTTCEFALELLRRLNLAEHAAKLRDSMCVAALIE
jgi:4-methyl-5(b-hydroxyethyl)-thiazole monophosphate biosynthesis